MDPSSDIVRQALELEERFRRQIDLALGSAQQAIQQHMRPLLTDHLFAAAEARSRDSASILLAKADAFSATQALSGILTEALKRSPLESLAENARTAAKAFGTAFAPSMLAETMTALELVQKSVVDTALSAVRVVDDLPKEIFSTIDLPGITATLAAARLPDFQTAFLAQLGDRIRELEQRDVTAEAVATEIKSAIETHAANLKRDWVTFISSPQFSLSIIVLILTIYIPKYHSDQQSKEQSRQQAKQFEELLQAVRQLHADELARIKSSAPDDAPANLHIVTRATVIRADRFANSPKIAVVYPKQVVHLLRTSKEWMYVEFFDYLEGKQRTGWMFKKYTEPRP